MPRAFTLLLLVPALLQAQATLGRLHYATPSGRAVTFRLIGVGPGRMTLAPETGDAERLRGFVLARMGAESKVAAGARVLSLAIPAGWRGGTGATDMIRVAEVTYWRYAPGQVLPAQFQAYGQPWRLLAADLPRAGQFEP